MKRPQQSGGRGTKPILLPVCARARREPSASMPNSNLRPPDLSTHAQRCIRAPIWANRQDLIYATALCEVVYYDADEARAQLARLEALLGLDAPLSDVTVHDAAGQK